MEDKMTLAIEEFAKQLVRVGTKKLQRVFIIDGVKYNLDVKFNRLKEKCQLCGNNLWEDEV